jgi:hypothetical protein
MFTYQHHDSDYSNISKYIEHVLKPLLKFKESYYTYVDPSSNKLFVETTHNYYVDGLYNLKINTPFWSIIMDSPEMLNQFKSVLLNFINKVDDHVIDINIGLLYKKNNFIQSDETYCSGFIISLIRDESYPCYITSLPTEIVLYINSFVELTDKLLITCKTLHKEKSNYYWLQKFILDYPCFDKIMTRPYKYEVIYKQLYQNKCRIPKINLILDEIVKDISNKEELVTFLGYENFLIDLEIIPKLVYNEVYDELILYLCNNTIYQDRLINSILIYVGSVINYRLKIFEIYTRVWKNPIKEILSMPINYKYRFTNEDFMKIINHSGNTEEDYINLLSRLSKIKSSGIMHYLWTKYNNLLTGDQINSILESMVSKRKDIKIIVMICNHKFIRDKYLIQDKFLI